MRIIPKTAKVKIEFFKNISLADTFIALVALALEVLVFTTNIPTVPKTAIMVFVLAITIWLYMPFDGQRFYMMFVNMTKYIFSVKHYSKAYTKANASIDNFIQSHPRGGISHPGHKQEIIYERCIYSI